MQVKIGDSDALLVKGPNVMLGYWDNEAATKAMFTADGWLNTGDTARIDAEGRLYITGPLKEIIVLSNGEKIPPVDMEAAILRDPFFEQVMVVGEGKPYLAVLVVPNKELWAKAAAEHGLDLASAAVVAAPAGGAARARAHQRADQAVSRLCADPPRGGDRAAVDHRERHADAHFEAEARQGHGAASRGM